MNHKSNIIKPPHLGYHTSQLRPYEGPLRHRHRSLITNHFTGSPLSNPRFRSSIFHFVNRYKQQQGYKSDNDVLNEVNLQIKRINGNIKGPILSNGPLSGPGPFQLIWSLIEVSDAKGCCVWCSWSYGHHRLRLRIKSPSNPQPRPYLVVSTSQGWATPLTHA